MYLTTDFLFKNIFQANISKSVNLGLILGGMVNTHKYFSVFEIFHNCIF